MNKSLQARGPMRITWGMGDTMAFPGLGRDGSALPTRGRRRVLRLALWAGLGAMAGHADVVASLLAPSIVEFRASYMAEARDRRFGGDFGGRDRGNSRGDDNGRGGKYDSGGKSDSGNKNDSNKTEKTNNEDGKFKDSDKFKDNGKSDSGNSDNDVKKGNSGNNTQSGAKSKSGTKSKPIKKDDEDDDDEPRTIADVIQRIVKPQPPPPLAATPELKNVTLSGPATNEILVSDAKPGQVEQARQLGFRVQQGKSHGSLGLSIVNLVPPPGMSDAQARSLLGQFMGSQLGRNYIYRPYRPQTGDVEPPRNLGAPRDRDLCGTGLCYAQDAIRWQRELHECARSVPIGFIDTAVDIKHPVLKGQQVHVGHLRRGNAPAKDLHHGTSTLAILAGAPNSAVVGLLPHATYYVADIFYADPNGEPITDSETLLAALNWMYEFNVRVINMSVAGPHDELMRDAIARLTKKGVLFVAAAGNGGPDSAPLYPAAYEQVIAVSAVANDLRSYRHANRGAHIDVAAPGVAIWTAVPNGAGYLSGTSFAAPFVTAVAAAVDASVRSKGKDNLLAKLSYKDLGPSGRDAVYGRGLIQAPSRCGSDKAPAVAAAPARKAAPASAASSWTTSTTVEPSTSNTASGFGAGGGISINPAGTFGFRD